MIDGYHLRGVKDEYLLVFRSDDPEAIERIIARLCASRDKETRALAEKLELEWNRRLNDQSFRGVSGDSRSQDGKKSKNGVRTRNRKVPPSK